MKTLQTIGIFMLVLLLVTAAAPARAVGSISLDDKDNKKDKEDDYKDSVGDMYAGHARVNEATERYILLLHVPKLSGSKVLIKGVIATKNSYYSGGFLTLKAVYDPKSGVIKGKWKGKEFSDRTGDVDGKSIPGGFKVTIKRSNDDGGIVFGKVTKVDDDDDRGGKDNDREAGNEPDDNSKPGGRSATPDDTSKPVGKSAKPEAKAKPAAKPVPSKPAHTKPPSGN